VAAHRAGGSASTGSRAPGGGPSGTPPRLVSAREAAQATPPLLDSQTWALLACGVAVLAATALATRRLSHRPG
jgi:hypothetical protein